MRHRREAKKATNQEHYQANDQEDVKDHTPKPSVHHFYGAWTLGFLVLGVYVRTLYPTIAGGDSGELVAESCHLGVSHPPGYPLFNMIVHIFVNYLPVPNVTPAWKANFFSALCDTLCAILIYNCILLWTKYQQYRGKTIAAFTASALYAFSPLTWTYAIGAEVFSLNNFFTALLLYTLLKYAIKGDLKMACYGAFFCGLAMCNQHTIVLFEIPIIIWVLWTRKKTLWPEKELFLLVSSFLLGLLPYLYMPLTMKYKPEQGSWGDVTTLSGFIHHLRRADYGTFKLFSTNEVTEDAWTRIKFYLWDLLTREGLYIVLPIGLLGLWLTLQKRFVHGVHVKSVGWLVASMLIFYTLVFHALSNLPLKEGLLYGVHMRFWQQPNIIVFIWSGIGLTFLFDFFTKPIAQSFKLQGIILVGFMLALVGGQLYRWYELCDQSQAYYIINYANAILEPLPADAILLINFDLQWTSLRYLQRCQKKRTDVTILNLSMMTYEWFQTKHDLYPELNFPGTRIVPFTSLRISDGFSLAQFLDSNIKDHDIFLGGKLTYEDQDLSQNYFFVPFGLVEQFYPVNQKIVFKKWYNTQKQLKEKIHTKLLPVFPPAHLYNDETWEWTIVRDYHMRMLSHATFQLEQAMKETPGNLAVLTETTHAMEFSLQNESEAFWSPTSVYKNLGLAYAEIVRSKEEYNVIEDPFRMPPSSSDQTDPTKFKDRAASRMLELWSEWIQLPNARLDPGFNAIMGVVEKFAPDIVHSIKNPKRQSKKKKKQAKKNKKKKTNKDKKQQLN